MYVKVSWQMHYWYFGSDDSCSCSVVCCLVHFTVFDIILGLYPLDSSITPTLQIMTIKNVSRHQHIFFRGQNYPQLRTIDSHKFYLSSYIFYDLCHFCLTSHHDSFFFFFSLNFSSQFTQGFVLYWEEHGTSLQKI